MSKRDTLYRASLPALFLSKLKLAAERREEADCVASVLADWKEAMMVGEKEKVSKWKHWDALSSKDKFERMHVLAQEADAYELTPYDQSDEEDYEGPYSGTDVQVIVGNRQWSVEHVIPRSMVDLKTEEGKQCISDPLGWFTETRRKNAQRSNLPLVLWKMPGEVVAERVPGTSDWTRLVHVLQSTKMLIEGEAHYVPCLEERARVARKWLYLRATYPNAVPPLSCAQKKHRYDILALVKRYPIQPVEVKMNDAHKRRFGRCNPLLETGGECWLDCPAFRRVVFGE